MVSRFRVLILLMVVAIAAVSASPTLAAAGGRGGSGNRTTAALAIWQNGVQVASAASGSTVDVKCSGLPANSTVYVGLMNTVGIKSVVTDGSGSCSVSWLLEYPGNYNFQVGTMSNKGYTIRATAALTVY